MRYFLEVAYKGTNYAGFQVQNNAVTIQGKVETALLILLKSPIALTGSSRTDAGVHARQNYFHFDIDRQISPALVYNLNALLPFDIVVLSLTPVPSDAHSRFLATSRRYQYFINTKKDPFLTDTSWFYPFSFDFQLLTEAAELLYNYNDFTSFSKKNTGSFTNQCTIIKSEWEKNDGRVVFTVEANRFLRGMVRALVGTMLQVGRKKISLADFESVIQSKDLSRSNFATPAHGLYLMRVNYPETIFI